MILGSKLTNVMKLTKGNLTKEIPTKERGGKMKKTNVNTAFFYLGQIVIGAACHDCGKYCKYY